MQSVSSPETCREPEMLDLNAFAQEFGQWLEKIADSIRDNAADKKSAEFKRELPDAAGFYWCFYPGHRPSSKGRLAVMEVVGEVPYLEAIVRCSDGVRTLHPGSSGVPVIGPRIEEPSKRDFPVKFL